MCVWRGEEGVTSWQFVKMACARALVYIMVCIFLCVCVRARAFVFILYVHVCECYRSEAFAVKLEASRKLAVAILPPTPPNPPTHSSKTRPGLTHGKPAA